MYYMKKTCKINARITAKVDKKLQEIVRSSGSNMSQIIMAAIEAYHAQCLASANQAPYETAKEFGIIGCADGSGDLSKNYKKYLQSDLKKNMIIADTGFFLALPDRNDTHHLRAATKLKELDQALITTIPIITETTHLVLPRLG